MKQRIRKPRLSLSKAEIAKIDALRKKHRDELRRGMPKDVAYYYERRDSGRTCRQACADLLRSGIPMSRGLRLLAGLHMLEGDELKKWRRRGTSGTFAGHRSRCRIIDKAAARREPQGRKTRAAECRSTSLARRSQFRQRQALKFYGDRGRTKRCEGVRSFGLLTVHQAFQL
jgi:hypothetical protein